MRTLLMKKAAGYLATASLVASPFVSSITVAMPQQTAFTTSSTSPRELSKSATNPVLVRNTTAKPEAPATTAPAKVQDKQAIGRCWKRLMNMVREMKSAHHSKK